MLISIDWIKDFTKLPNVDAEELGKRFTMGTAEVEDVLVSGEFYKGITVVEVIKKEPHPDAEKLNLVTFNSSEGEKKVVCGASNVKVGMKTPFAKLGTCFPDGFTLTPKKIRGVLSEGMLCSEKELELSSESDGIMELDQNIPIGKTMLEVLGKKEDVLLDIDNKSLTHRPDLWGHIGMAREFGAVFKCDFIDPYDSKWKERLESKFTTEDSPVKPKVFEGSSCLAYYGLSLKNIKVSESPEWLKTRLTAVGLRPINNIVDISNYVMLELGIPLHIFDRKLIEGEEINIHPLKEEAIFVTLDEIERKLVSGDTVISDKNKPLVLAGIMGGLNSGVNEKTSDIFIEVANWKAADVRKTSTRLGLRTDSSQRYEKTLDSKLCYKTLLRTLDVILELCPGAEVVGKAEYDGNDLDKIQTVKLETSVESICRQLGKKIDKKEILDIFQRLDFEVMDKDNSLEVIVPSYRSTKDIECEADLVEEVGRIIGYDNIEPTSPLLEVLPVKLSPAQKIHREIKNFLVNNGSCYEVMTYPLVGEKLLKQADMAELDSIKIINSLSKDNDRMRRSMIPSFLQALALNSKNLSEARIFEIGRTYHPDEKNFSRDKHNLAIAFFDKDKSQFMELVDLSERLFRNINLPVDLTLKNEKFKNLTIDQDWSGVHPYEFYNTKVMGKPLGAVFTVHPLTLRKFKIKGHASILVLDLSNFEERPLKEKVKYKPILKYPISNFDYTIVLDGKDPVSAPLEILKKIKMKEISNHSVVDVYFDSSGKKSVTLRTSFSDPEKTLDGDFLKEAEQTIVNKLATEGFSLKES